MTKTNEPDPNEADPNVGVNLSRPNLIRAWWPAAVWVVLIAFESTDFFSSNNTGGLLYSLLTRLFGQINLYFFLIFHHVLRKTGHVVGYGMLALLLLRGWRATLDQYKTQLARHLIAVMVGHRLCGQHGRMAPKLHSLPHRNLEGCSARQHRRPCVSSSSILVVEQNPGE